ncbi:MAG TPA: DUF1801 domain-containing protein [Chitinophagaceae bacterium]|nr:DUF1801 domain-containing protein [Chitinophagaceae bacterium]
MSQVDAYIEALPDETRELCAQIREMIQELVPGIQEKLSFKLPFYHYFGMFMYLQAKPGGIAVTFLRGKDLVMAFPQLEQKDRAIAASLLISNRNDITQFSLREIIVAAADWNREAKQMKLPMVTRRAKK